VAKNILLLFGGVSGEHEVSCVSAKFIEKTLIEAKYQVIPVYINTEGNWHYQSRVPDNPEKHEINPCFLHRHSDCQIQTTDNKFPVDFAFPIIHGTTGEDGKLQGFFEFVDIPYAGSDVLSSALCMNKYYSKLIFQSAHIPQVSFIKVEKHEWTKFPEKIINNIAKDFRFPVFTKPASMGSSVGISRVQNPENLNEAIEHALKFDDLVMCEQGISAREIEVSILGNFPDYKVSIPGEIISSHDFYSYEAKYLDTNGARLVIPAEISPDQSMTIQELAVKSFTSVQGCGFARIDFFLNKEDNHIYLNEINTLPGFTPVSMFPKLWEQSGLKSVDLIHKIIQLGVEKYKQKKTLKTRRNG